MTKEEKRQKRLEKRAREERINNIIGKVFPWVVSCIIMIIGYFIFKSCSNYEKERAQEILNSTEYRIEVIDKYDCIGSTYHLIGGRAPEQEYHIIYKVIPLTENADKHYYGDGEEDNEVSYKTYRKIKIGDKFKGHSNNIEYYY
jgi:hypothetical protein